jgi:hypothetical protein
MIVKTTINKCQECRYANHSGAFILRGTKLLCSHPMSPRKIKYRAPFLNEKEPTKWPNKIPNWCPLKNGVEY